MPNGYGMVMLPHLSGHPGWAPPPASAHAERRRLCRRKNHKGAISLSLSPPPPPPPPPFSPLSTAYALRIGQIEKNVKTDEIGSGPIGGRHSLREREREREIGQRKFRRGHQNRFSVREFIDLHVDLHPSLKMTDKIRRQALSAESVDFPSLSVWAIEVSSRTRFAKESTYKKSTLRSICMRLYPKRTLESIHCLYYGWEKGIPTL